MAFRGWPCETKLQGQIDPHGRQLYKTTVGFWWIEPGRAIFIPAGFITDGASVPGCMLWLIPAYEKATFRACVLHDFAIEAPEFTRAQADGLFNRALKSEGVPLLKRYAMRCGVRVNGWYKTHFLGHK